MHKIHIYIECDHKLLRASEKRFGYIKVMPDGSKRRFISSPQMLTWHRATLTALCMALSKLEDNYEAHIYSSNGYVMKQIQSGNLEKWEQNGYKGKAGPVKDQELWHQVYVKSQFQKIIVHEGTHMYQNRLQDMFDGMKAG